MEKPLKISIALTTYNGSKYIVQLLDSLKQQSLAPNEVIIVDDNSTDNTVEIVQNYIKKCNLVNWKIYRNPKNLGWQKNFTKAISKTTGDYIFLADQDDVWHKSKIKEFMECFLKTNAWMVVSDFKIIGNGSSKKTTSMPKINYQIEKKSKKIKFDKNYALILRPGCVMAINSVLKKIYLDLWFEKTPHDALLWLIANITNNIYYIDSPSIDFRRTNDNASGSIAHDVSFKKNAIIREKKVNEWYLNSEFVNKSFAEIIKRNTTWNDLRYDLLINHKLISWIKLFKYKDCYKTNKQYLGDLYYYLISKNN